MAHKSEENIPIVLVGVARIGYQRRVTTTEIEVAAGLLGCHYVEVRTGSALVFAWCRSARVCVCVCEKVVEGR